MFKSPYGSIGASFFLYMFFSRCSFVCILSDQHRWVDNVWRERETARKSSSLFHLFFFLFDLLQRERKRILFFGEKDGMLSADSNVGYLFYIHKFRGHHSWCLDIFVSMAVLHGSASSERVHSAFLINNERNMVSAGDIHRFGNVSNQCGFIRVIDNAIDAQLAFMATTHGVHFT